jgi:predicted homoserine dehydrogenase-like protein
VWLRRGDRSKRLIRRGQYAVTEDARLLCQAEGIDAGLEVAGDVELGAHVALHAIENQKHIIMERRVMTNVDGDQPGVFMNLYRFVKGLGVQPILAGNIKGLHDPYRNPTTQEAFARQWHQKPHMVTSFADGTKISFEQAIVANATGMRVAQRGMYGPTVPAGTPIQEAVQSLPLESIMASPGL